MTNPHDGFIGRARRSGQATADVAESGALLQAMGVFSSPNRRQQAKGGQQ